MQVWRVEIASGTHCMILMAAISSFFRKAERGPMAVPVVRSLKVNKQQIISLGAKGGRRLNDS